VDAQRQADAVGVPKLSRRAEKAIAALVAAPDDKARAAAWRGISEDKIVGGEVERFRQAVTAALRRRRGARHAAQPGRTNRGSLRAVSRTMHVLEEGEFAREKHDPASSSTVGSARLVGGRPPPGRRIRPVAGVAGGATRSFAPRMMVLRATPVAWNTAAVPP
jgi:hypothetical protein